MSRKEVLDNFVPEDCTCYHDCRSCTLSGDWHVHPGERCPVHLDAPGDH